MLYANCRQYVSTANANNRLRCFFYISKKLAEDERAQTEGVLIAVLLVMPRVPDLDHGFVKRLWKVEQTAFPVKGSVHGLCYLPKLASKHGLVQELIFQYVSVMMQLGLLVDVHIEKEEGKVLQELLNIGVTREGLPTSIGGSWTFIEAMAWCRARTLET